MKIPKTAFFYARNKVEKGMLLLLDLVDVVSFAGFVLYNNKVRLKNLKTGCLIQLTDKISGWENMQPYSRQIMEIDKDSIVLVLEVMWNPYLSREMIIKDEINPLQLLILHKNQKVWINLPPTGGFVLLTK